MILYGITNSSFLWNFGTSLPDSAIFFYLIVVHCLSNSSCKFYNLFGFNNPIYLKALLKWAYGSSIILNSLFIISDTWFLA
jgi:hypothetical protein